MGRQIKSSALTLDVSEMSGAPVAPVNAMRIRPKADGTTLQLSYNTGAYFDMGASGGPGSVRLDQVLDPTMDKAFAMAGNRLAFQYSGADAEDCFVLESATNAAGSGVVCLIRTQGTTSTKAPLRVDANGVVALTVDTAGNVGVRGYDSGYDFNVAGSSHFITTNLDDVPAVEIETTSDVANGAQGFLVSNNQNGSLATDYVGIEFTSNLQFTSGTGGDVAAFRSSYTGAPATSNRRLQNIVAFFDDNQSTDVTGSYTAFMATQNLSGSGSYSGVWRGFYARNPASTWSAYYGFLAEAGLKNGFGVTPTATLHASGTVRFDLGSDATGDVYYRAATTGLLTAVHPATNGWVLTLSAGLPVWAVAPGASGGTPGTPLSSLQWNSAGAFAGLTDSVVSGANLLLGGTLTVQASTSQNKKWLADPTATNLTQKLTEYGGTSTAPTVIVFERARGSFGSPSNIVSGDVLGKVDFQGRLAGSLTTVGFLQASYDTTEGGIIQISTGQTTPRTFVALGTATDTVTIQGFNGSSFNILSVTPSGISITAGSSGGVYYKDASGYFAAVSITGSSGKFLKSNGTLPSWQSIATTDLTGTVSLAQGGTGSSLVDPNADRILFWDDSAGVVDWLTAGSGLTITGTTITATAGGTPAGSGSEIQYRNAGAFGAITNTAVSGANITAGGTFTLDAAGVADQSMVLSSVTSSDTKITFTEYRTAVTPILLQFDRHGGSFASPSNIATNMVIGQLTFRGRVGGVVAQQGWLRCLWTTGDGGSVELGAGATAGSGTRFLATVNSGAGIFDVGGNSFTVSGSGFTFSHGTTGSLYYRSSFGLFTALTVGSATQYLKGGTIPAWGSVLTSDLSGTISLAQGGTGQALVDPNADRILFWDDSAGVVTWLTASTGLTITGTTMTASGSTSPAGSGSELQYRNAGAFGAVASSSVDGSGVITNGSGQEIWKSDSSVLLSLRSYNSTAAQAPQLSILRSRGSEGSKSAVLAGDTLFTMPISGEYDSAGAREAARITVDAMTNFSSTSASTVFRLKTTQENAIFPNERLVIGGTKQLTNATLTDLFTITFGTADQLAMGGEVHLLLVAKGLISGVVHTFVHRRVISFAIAHNANNDMMVNFTEVQQHRSGGASDDVGLTAISHALNSDGAVGTGTNIPSTPNAYATNAITYKILATAVPNLSSASQLTCYYHIIYHGEASLTLS